MKTRKVLGILAVAALAVLLFALGTTFASTTPPAVERPEKVVDAPTSVTLPPARSVRLQQAIIVDHNHTDISKIPDYWLEEAKKLTVHYAHTSHGGQVLSGLHKLEDVDARYDVAIQASGDVVLPSGEGALRIYDGNNLGGGDTYITPDEYWESLSGISSTQSVANTGWFSYSTWTWCGQAGSYSTAQIQEYLDVMTGLETQYPDMRFVLMTGHTNGGGEILARNNGLIRQYASDNNMVLFDFADIETYDPLGGGPYDNNGDGTCTWCVEFCAAHPEYCIDLPTSCAHSNDHPEDRLFCKLKANAFWWMMARLAGWDGVTDGDVQVTPSTDTVQHGQSVTFTVTIRDLAAPPTATVYLTNEVPSGLAYVPGSLEASTGSADDGIAPILHWSGFLTPTPVVTVAFAAEVTYGSGSGDDFPHYITNTAVVDVPGYQTLTRTATITVERSPGMANLSPSYKLISTRYADFGERVTYTIGIRNSTGPLAGTVYMTDTLPEGQQYVTGTFSATSGQTTLFPVLCWSGVLSPTPAVTLTYAVTITQIGTGTLLPPRTDVNTATIAYEDQAPIVRTATLRTHWVSVFLPLVLQD